MDPDQFPSNKIRLLKVKIKALAAEAQALRKESHRSRFEYERLELHARRVYFVRREARAHQLAYAFLRDKPYHKVESQRSLAKASWYSLGWLVLAVAELVYNHEVYYRGWPNEADKKRIKLFIRQKIRTWMTSTP